MQNDNLILKKDNDTLIHNNTELKNNINNEINEKNNDKEEIIRENDDLKAKNKVLFNENNKLKNNNDQITRENNDLTNKNVWIIKENNELKERNENLICQYNNNENKGKESKKKIQNYSIFLFKIHSFLKKGNIWRRIDVSICPYLGESSWGKKGIQRAHKD